MGKIIFRFIQACINTKASALDPSYLGVIWVTKVGEQVNWIEKGNMFLDNQVLETVEVAHFTVQFAGFS